MFGLGQKSPLRKIPTLIVGSFSIEPFFFCFLSQNTFFSETWIILESVANKKLSENAGYNTLELLAQLGFAISKTELGIENKTTLYTNWLTT